MQLPHWTFAANPMHQLVAAELDLGRIQAKVGIYINIPVMHDRMSTVGQDTVTLS